MEIVFGLEYSVEWLPESGDGGMGRFRRGLFINFDFVVLLRMFW